VEHLVLKGGTYKYRPTILEGRLMYIDTIAIMTAQLYSTNKYRVGTTLEEDQHNAAKLAVKLYNIAVAEANAEDFDVNHR